jgi:hypothetical protein
MDATLVSWLDSVGRTAFTWSLGLFLAVNAAAAIGFVLRRDRALVNRWTSRILAIDLLLLGAGVGVPLVTTMTRMTVSALATTVKGAEIGGVGATEMVPAR